MCHHHLQAQCLTTTLLLYVCASSNEVIAKLKDVGTRITNEIKRDIGQQWKNLSNEDRQKYKHLAELAKEDLAKQKAVLPPKPKKRKLHNRMSLKSIVRIVQKLSTDQRLVVELIGLSGILQLRCTVLNHPLCNWLVKNFDPKTRSLTVHGRTFLLTVAHVHECLGINAQGKVIDLEVNMSDEFSQLCENMGMTKGVVQLKELREFLEETEEVGDVFKRKFSLYILGCFLCPTTKLGVTRSFMNSVSDVVEMGNQNWANLTLDFLCKGIQEQRDKHLVQPNGCLFLLVVFYFDRVSPSPTIISKSLASSKYDTGEHFGSEMLSDLQAQIAQEMDLKHGLEGQSSDLLTQLTRLHTCQTSSLNEFETHDPMLNQSKAVSTNPTQASHLTSEMLSKLQQQEQPPPQMAQQMDLNQSVILEVESSPLFTGVHTCETSTPNELKTPDPALNKSKAVYDMPTSCFDQYNMGNDTRNERIEMEMMRMYLKPKAWILDTIINLVAVQLTNEERSNHPDKRHFMWYLPVLVSRQILGNPNLNDSDLKKLCGSYFGDENFTADLSSCSMIYIPTNDRGNHWFCIKVDLAIRWLTFSIRSRPLDPICSMEVLHRTLRLQYEDLYKADVNKFKIANVERQPLQHETGGWTIKQPRQRGKSSACCIPTSPAEDALFGSFVKGFLCIVMPDLSGCFSGHHCLVAVAVSVAVCHATELICSTWIRRSAMTGIGRFSNLVMICHFCYGDGCMRDVAAVVLFCILRIVAITADAQIVLMRFQFYLGTSV
ncbi:hypothetical protein C3L33_22275, partial [Rhododendron williamsianum]